MGGGGGRWKAMDAGGDGRPTKGKGEGGRGNARPGYVREETERRRCKGRGEASQKVGSPSILQNQKSTQKHTWQSSKHKTHTPITLNTFIPIPTSLNQKHVQYFQLKKKF